MNQHLRATQHLRPALPLRPTRAGSTGPSVARIVRDRLLRRITLCLGRVLLPAAWVRSRRDPRSRAAQWALQLRFPHESLVGLTPAMTCALGRARSVAFWEHDLLIGVTSGHRTVQEQQRMHLKDLARRESTAGVQPRSLPAERSQHVAGLAADLRPREAAMWLERNGHRFDLYRTYANEWWHFEYLPQARGIAPRLLAHPGARVPDEPGTPNPGRPRMTGRAQVAGPGIGPRSTQRARAARVPPTPRRARRSALPHRVP